MEAGRETRFSKDVIDLACARVDAVKDKIMAGAGVSDADKGHAILDHFGWSLFAIWETTQHAVQEAMEHTEHFSEDPILRAHTAIALAFMEGMTYGAVCSDVTYEVASGLTELSA